MITSPSLPEAGSRSDLLPRPTRSVSVNLILGGFVFAFAGLLVSFPVRNPNLWSHFLNGRQLLSGHLDSLSPEWLFDLVCYLLNSVGGGIGLVGVKAALVGLLGVLLYRTGRGVGSHFVLATVCAMLAVLTLSSWANVRPLTVSLVCLGLAAWWMRDTPDDARRKAFPWHLFGLFLIWANADCGFVTGLLVVIAIWLGRTMDRRSGRVKTGFGWWAWWPLSLIGACLLNPAHLHGFPLPPEFGWVAKWPALAMLFGPVSEELRSPFTVQYASRYLDSPAVLAYYPLVIGGLLSFALNRNGFRWQRFLPWVLTGVLSAYTDRAIPVFAVVGGPILALNLGDLFGRAAEVSAPRIRWFRLAPMVLGLAFLVAAWPGWLQGPPYEPRRWGIDIPNSPELACERIRAFHADGRFAEGTRTLHLTPQSAKAFAWFCPTDDGVYDADLANDLIRGTPPPALAQRMRDGRFTRLVVYHEDVNQLRNPLRNTLYFSAQWPLLFVRGGVAVFGWREAVEPVTTRGLDLSDPWFDLAEEDRRDVPHTRYPAWSDTVRDQFVRPTPARSIHRDEAALLLLMAEVSREFVPLRNQIAWPVEQLVGMIGSAGVSANPISAGADVALRLSYLEPPGAPDAAPPVLTRVIDYQFRNAVQAKSDCLPGPLFAAVRAARRAVTETPGDPVAHLLLGESYLRVMDTSRYRAWAAPGKFRKAADLLQAQTVAALSRGISRSRTPPHRSHLQLAEMYLLIGYLDLALEHFKKARAALDHPKNARDIRLSAEEEKAFREIESQDRKRLDDQIQLLGNEVAEREKKYGTDTTTALSLTRVNAAGSLQLQGLALRLLTGSDVSAFGAEGTTIELNLFLRTGRTDDVIDWTTIDPSAVVEPGKSSTVRDLLGVQTYHWYRGQALAASGASDEADEELANIEGGAAALVPDTRLLGETTAVIAALNVLAESPRALGIHDAIGQVIALSDSSRRQGNLREQLRRMAEVSVLRAMVAAESGDLVMTKEMCQAVLEFTPAQTGRIEQTLRGIAVDLLNDLETHERNRQPRSSPPPQK